MQVNYIETIGRKNRRGKTQMQQSNDREGRRTKLVQGGTTRGIVEKYQ